VSQLVRLEVEIFEFVGVLKRCSARPATSVCIGVGGVFVGCESRCVQELSSPSEFHNVIVEGNSNVRGIGTWSRESCMSVVSIVLDKLLWRKGCMAEDGHENINDLLGMQ
jgi:hypothetical protein